MSQPFEMSLSYGVLRGLEFFPGNSEKALMVHGWLDNAASFSRLAPLLTGHHVIAVDLPGHGHSDHRAPGGPYHLVDYIPILIELLDRLEFSRVSLIGHSLGAGICSLIAAVCPERVSRLVLIDGLGPMSDGAETATDRLRRSVKRHALLRNKRQPVYGSIAAATQARLAVTRMREVSARLIVQRNMKPIEGGYTWRTDRRVTLASPVYLVEDQVQQLLRDVECETMLIRAEHGVVNRLSTSNGRIECYATLTIRNLVGDHHLHLDDPEPVADCIVDFLSAGQ